MRVEVSLRRMVVEFFVYGYFDAGSGKEITHLNDAIFSGLPDEVQEVKRIIDAIRLHDSGSRTMEADLRSSANKVLIAFANKALIAEVSENEPWFYRELGSTPTPVRELEA